MVPVAADHHLLMSRKGVSLATFCSRPASALSGGADRAPGSAIVAPHQPQSRITWMVTTGRIAPGQRVRRLRQVAVPVSSGTFCRWGRAAG
jgi:hypothetical protein